MGENLSNYVFDTLVDFDLCEKLFCITTDNASNNKTMITHLFENLYIRTGIQHDEKNQHIPCLTHIINLVIVAFLKSLKVTTEAGDQGEDEVMYHRIHGGNEKDFALTMFKIREISKVLFSVTYKCSFLGWRRCICTLHHHLGIYKLSPARNYPPAHNERKNLRKHAQQHQSDTYKSSTMFPLDGIRHTPCLSEPCTCIEPSICISPSNVISHI